MSYSTILYCYLALVLQTSSLHSRVLYPSETSVNHSLSSPPALAEVRQEAERAAKEGCYQEAYEIAKIYLSTSEDQVTFTAPFSTKPSLSQAFYGMITLILLLFWRSRQNETMTSQNSSPFESKNEATTTLSDALDLTPKHNAGGSESNLGSPFLYQTKKVILEHLEEESFGIAELSKALCLSRSQLHRKIKSETSYSPSVFMRKVRLAKAEKLLTVKAGNISEVAFMVGMPNLAHFSRSFKAEFGYPPSKLLFNEELIQSGGVNDG